MLTEQEIKSQYAAHHGRPMAQVDYDAFLKFLTMFGIVEFSSYTDAADQISANIGLLRYPLSTESIN